MGSGAGPSGAVRPRAGSRAQAVVLRARASSHAGMDGRMRASMVPARNSSCFGAAAAQPPRLEASGAQEVSGPDATGAKD